MSKLWKYNLHYFDWLWELEFETAKAAAAGWITRHGLKIGQVGWDPYPTSLRLMNWTGAFWGKWRDRLEEDSDFLKTLWGSLFVQAEWLMRNVEHHLLANHILENAAALAFAGSCFEGQAAKGWFRRGLAILKKQLPEQIPPDGMHFERSPMYHCRMLYVLLLLLSTGNRGLTETLSDPVFRMASVLSHISHPDGRIALLNDSAFGICHDPGELLEFARSLLSNGHSISPLKPGPFALKDAGYYGWSSPEGHYIICDAGPMGPDYQPGHAHAGIFSFELSLSGRRVIVDSGVCTYEPDEDRDYCRATRAHNTVEITGKDQCELWGSFRVARRARVQLLEWRPSHNGFELHAVHNGYGRVRPGLRHMRRFSWNPEGRLNLTDSIENLGSEQPASRLHLNPECNIDHLEGGTAVVSVDSIRLQISFKGAGHLSVEDSTYCPEFGRKMRNRQLVFRPDSGVSKWNCEICLC